MTMRPTPASMTPYDFNDVKAWHEAGHVFACWKAKCLIDFVTLNGVKHNAIPEAWHELRNALAGTAAISLYLNWSFEESFLYGGAMGADGKGGDPHDAMFAARKYLRPNPQGFYLEEMPRIFAETRRAYDEVRAEMVIPAGWREVSAIAAILKQLPNDFASIQGDALAAQLGRTT